MVCARTGQFFGASHIIDVLRGSHAEKVLKHGHGNLSTYGIGKDLSKAQWLHLSRQFLQKGLLAQDLEYGSLKLTPKAHEVLRGQEKVFGTVQAETADFGSEKNERVEYDRELFEILRKLRKRLADEQNVAPFVVFADKTLIEMASFYPQARESLRRISGVGQAKLEKYGAEFLREISRYCRERGLQEKFPASTNPASVSSASNLTFRTPLMAEAYNTGKSIEEVAQQFAVKPGTILDHLQNYQRAGHALRPEGFAEYSKLSAEERERVRQVFEQHGANYLRRVFDALGGNVSFDELRVLRLEFLSRQS